MLGQVPGRGGATAPGSRGAREGTLDTLRKSRISKEDLKESCLLSQDGSHRPIWSSYSRELIDPPGLYFRDLRDYPGLYFRDLRDYPGLYFRT